MKSAEELLVWQRAIDLAEAAYALSRSLPREEVYGLRAQLTRAAVSVASNIAEGHGRLTDGEFLHFLGVARGSLAEVRTLTIVIRRTCDVPGESLDRCDTAAEEVSRMLAGLIQHVRSRRTNDGRGGPS